MSRANPFATRPPGVLEIVVPRLRFTFEREGGLPSVRVEVKDGDVCRIGSHGSNDVVLEDPLVSRFHCRLSREPSGWRVYDTASKNGTYLDGVKVRDADLPPDSVLTLGDTTLRVSTKEEGAGLSMPAATNFGAILGESVAMRRLFSLLERVAERDIDVLIEGESGTGKELVATELVRRSTRADRPLVIVDCGAMSASLIESELFGHVRGAFTGADRDRIGAFEAADGGTVFLDEIGELPLELQPKLLRALEQREVRRVGETRARTVDVRVISATHRDLEREVNRGRFREDLYFRIAKVCLRVPPLRERIEDLSLLVHGFLDALAEPGADRLFTPLVMEEMARHDWPGNVRELRNYVERSVVLDAVSPARRGPPLPDASSRPPAMRTGTSSFPPASGNLPASVGQAISSFPPSGSQPTSPNRQALSSNPPGFYERVAVEKHPDVESGLSFRAAKEAAVDTFERAFLSALLAKCEGNLSKAARTASMDRMYLHQLVQKHGLRGIRAEARNAEAAEKKAKG